MKQIVFGFMYIWLRSVELSPVKLLGLAEYLIEGGASYEVHALLENAVKLAQIYY